VKKEGWIMGRRGRMEMRRIPYLAAARNKAMAPLKLMAQREGEGRRVFDRVVWLNDVIFSVGSVFPLSPFLSSIVSNQDSGDKQLTGFIAAGPTYNAPHNPQWLLQRSVRP
jgi:hypothetical protein